MASEVLASGTTAATTADIVLADGATKTFILRGSGRIALQYKRSDGTYKTFTTMDPHRHIVPVTGPATLRGNRPVQASAAALDSEG